MIKYSAVKDFTSFPFLGAYITPDTMSSLSKGEPALYEFIPGCLWEVRLVCGALMVVKEYHKDEGYPNLG